MSTEFSDRLIATIREHPALLVTAFYVAASAVGMFYSWAYLRSFGINVFNYSQLSDFLIASLKEPFTWVLVAFCVGVVMLDNASSRRVERKGPARWLRWYGARQYRFFNNFIAVFVVAIALFVYAQGQATQTRGGSGKDVTLQLAGDGDSVAALLLGTTGQFVFLYHRDANRVDIHPIESIQSISFQASP